MARRIKEEPIVHQKRIAGEAMKLFSKNGIDNTRMDEIASLSGYSKATLYVYFKNKEDIVSFLSLESMKKLKESMESAFFTEHTKKEAFFLLCDSLVKYQQDYPDFFSLCLKYICLSSKEGGEWDSETYEVGEEINRILFEYLDSGIKNGDFKESGNYLSTIFQIWGMLSGLITLASEKEEYLYKAGKIERDKFLKDGFESIYKVIEK